MQWRHASDWLAERDSASRERSQGPLILLLDDSLAAGVEIITPFANQSYSRAEESTGVRKDPNSLNLEVSKYVAPRVLQAACNGPV